MEQSGRVLFCGVFAIVVGYSRATVSGGKGKCLTNNGASQSARHVVQPGDHHPASELATGAGRLPKDSRRGGGGDY